MSRPVLHCAVSRRVGIAICPQLDGPNKMPVASAISASASSWEQIAMPTRLLTAQWSTGRDTPPAYPPEAVERFQKELKTLAMVKTVPGVDHAASIMSPVGARATAELLSEAL